MLLTILVPCEKIEPLFFLDYSVNMYSRKTTLHTRLWNALLKVSMFFTEYSASYSRKTGGPIFFASDCRVMKHLYNRMSIVNIDSVKKCLIKNCESDWKKSVSCKTKLKLYECIKDTCYA